MDDQMRHVGIRLLVHPPQHDAVLLDGYVQWEIGTTFLTMSKDGGLRGPRCGRLTSLHDVSPSAQARWRPLPPCQPVPVLEAVASDDVVTWSSVARDDQGSGVPDTGADGGTSFAKK